MPLVIVRMTRWPFGRYSVIEPVELEELELLEPDAPLATYRTPLPSMAIATGAVRPAVIVRICVPVPAANTATDAPEELELLEPPALLRT
jgi:hypothetical protein